MWPFRRATNRHLPVEPPPGHRWFLRPIGGDQTTYQFELRLNRLDGGYSGLMSYLVYAREIRRASEKIVRAYERQTHNARLAERVNR